MFHGGLRMICTLLVRQTPQILVLGMRRGAHQAERKTAPRLGHAGQLQPLARRGAGRPLVAADRKQHLRAGPPTWLGTSLLYPPDRSPSA